MNSEANFPRYRYHLSLLQNIVRHAEKKGIAISSSNFIFIFFKPLTFVKCNGKSSYVNICYLDILTGKVSFNSHLIYFLADQSKTNIIKILLADTFDAKCKEIFFSQVCTDELNEAFLLFIFETKKHTVQK